MIHSDPLSLVRAAIEMANRADWHAAATLCDPVSLAAFRRQLLEQFEPAAPRSEVTVEEYLRHSPEMPRAVAEYHVAQHRTRSDPAQRLREELPGVRDVNALQTLSPEAVFAAWLDGRSPHRQIERLAAEGRITLATAAHSADLAMAVYPYIVVGAVEDGDRIAHVLYRFDVDVGKSTNDEAEAWVAQRPAEEQELARELSGREHPQVVTCRLQPDGSWRLLAGYDFLGVGGIAIHTVDEGEEQRAESDDSAA